MWEMLSMYLTFPFVQNALIAGTLIALSASLLGVPLVLRRMSFMGDALSHIAFLAMILAGVLRISMDMVFVIPITIVCTVLLLRPRRQEGAGSDARLAMLSVSSLALGYLVVSMYSSSGNVSGDVCTSLFGSTSILTLRAADVTLCVVMSAIVLAVFAMFYHRIFAMTFDESFCRATGVHTRAYHVVMAVIIAVIIVLAMELVGSLLTTALMVFPALSAMRVMRSFRGVVILSALLSVISTALGIVLSILVSTPVGSTIVALECAVYGLCTLAGCVKCH